MSVRKEQNIKVPRVAYPKVQKPKDEPPQAVQTPWLSKEEYIDKLKKEGRYISSSEMSPMDKKIVQILMMVKEIKELLEIKNTEHLVVD